MNPLLREFDLDRDAGTLAELLTSVRGETVTEDDAIQASRRNMSLGTFRALIAADGSAYGRTFQQPWFVAGQFGISIAVRPEARCRGLGTRLLTGITEIGLSMGATTQIASVRDGDEAGLRFASRYGFVAVHHLAKSTLDPRTVDPATLAVPVPAGITISTLAELGDTDANRRRLWEITEATAVDIPGEIRRRRTYEEFTSQMIDVSWFRPAGQFIALDGEVWVGVAAVGYTESRNLLYHNMTGVDRTYRGRGIATALKRATIAYAISSGADVLETHNDSRNAPMLAINQALGYQGGIGVTEVKRSIEP